VQLLVSALSVI